MIRYEREPHSDIAFIDMKSFYASVECVQRGCHPLTTSLCVMSRQDHASGLILASSPTFKRVFGKKNVGRNYDLPFHVHNRRFNYQAAKRNHLPTDPAYVHYIETWARKTLIVPPRMELYIQENLKIQEVFLNYIPKEEILPYSIDESLLDLSQSLDYFVRDSSLSRRQKLDLVSAAIQRDIHQTTGIYSVVGMSNANPLLAKLALDNEAKSNKHMRANWSYEDVPTKVWSIPKLTDFWGIGPQIERRLNRMGIHSVRELAHSNPDNLKAEFGVMGVQLWFHAHGVDESNVHQPYHPQSKGLGNSQVLHKNYHRATDIELVLTEMAEQVAIRLRREGKKTCCVSIQIGFARHVKEKGIQVQKKVAPTQSTRELKNHVRQLFYDHYESGAVRTVGVRYSQLVDEGYALISLFDDPVQEEKQEQLERTVDQIREEFGFLAVQPATVLNEHSRNVERSRLIGGHAAGGAGGLEGLA